MRDASELLPLQFRVLFRQFVLRVIDLESLSIQADIPRFLGQFASILVFISLVGSLALLMSNSSLRSTPEGYLSFVWRGEQALISGTMLVVGLVVVVSWDATFPDRRDVMVLCPLPVSPRMILVAKLAASAALISLAILTLSFATGFAWPLFIGAHHESVWGFLQSLSAYWLTIIAASGFLLCVKRPGADGVVSPAQNISSPFCIPADNGFRPSARSLFPSTVDHYGCGNGGS